MEVNVVPTNYDNISLTEAKMRATELRFQIEPLCHEFEIAGSVRRYEPFVKDIEIVCVPRVGPMKVHGNLFPVKTNRVIHWLQKPENDSVSILKGGPKYYQFVYQNAVTVDLFMTTPHEFGRMLAIRTGPENYSKKMSSRWAKLGYHGQDGELYHEETGERAGPWETELDFFEWLGWNYVKPEARK